MSTKQSEQLALWRERLNASGLPVFSRTVREIHSVSTNRSTSAKDLSDVIGHDASIAKAGGDKNEEVFVAALLKDVGEMAFWSKAEAEARALEQELNADRPHGEAERRVLGFELSQLSRALAHDWNLGDLLDNVLDGHHVEDRRVQHVNFAHEVAQVLEHEAWGSPAVADLMARLAKHLNLKERDVEAMVCANLDDAVALAERFGISKLGDALPDQPAASPDDCVSTNSNTDNQEVAAQVDAPEALPQPSSTFNPEKLLAVLDVVADGIEQGVARDVLMQTVVDALHDALGMEHAYFALFSPDRSRLYIKYAAGQQTTALRNLSCDVAGNLLLAKATVERKMTTFCDVPADGAWHRGGSGAVAGIYLGGRSVGVLYAELCPGQMLCDTQLSGFRQLGQQIALVLAQT